jgi:acetyl-CoA/propionyl-CoA carboxylase biotin carboxyl carrier protein
VRGHAIEVRIYAEDPFRGYIPTPGKVERLRWPTGTGIRVESGIEEGQEVGIQFDSMLAKLVVHAQNRDHALARMRFALDETVILGLGTNQPFLRTLCDDPFVIAGNVYTNYLENEFAKSTQAPILSELDLGLISAASGQGLGRAGSANQEGGKNFPSPWRL